MLDDEVRAVIVAARALIADPLDWCQFVPAKRDGVRTDADDPLATQICASSAVEILTEEDRPMRKEVFQTLDGLVVREYAEQRWITMYGNRPMERSFLRLWHVNDHLGHEAVLHIFDLALGE